MTLAAPLPDLELSGYVYSATLWEEKRNHDWKANAGQDVDLHLADEAETATC